MSDGPVRNRGDWEDGYARRQQVRQQALRRKAAEEPFTAVMVFQVIGSIAASAGAGLAAAGFVATLDFHPLMAIGAGLGAGGFVAMTLLRVLLRQRGGGAPVAGFDLSGRPALETPKVNTASLPASRAELVQNVLAEATRHLKRLEQALTQLRDFEHVASVAKMVAVGQRVAKTVAESPDKLAGAQRLFTFYCPQAVEVVETLVQLQNDPRRDEARISSTRDVLTKLEAVFDKTELDLKSADGQVLDIELKVLNQALDEDLKR